MEFMVTYYYSQLRRHLFEVAVALGTVIILVKLLPTLFKTYELHMAFKKVPYIPMYLHWLMGHSLEALQDPFEAIRKWSQLAFKNKQKVYKLNTGPTINRLICFHPDTTKLVLRSDPKGDELYYPFLPWLGRGLNTANGKEWLRNRRLLTPAFYQDILRSYIKVYEDCVSETIDLWKKMPEGESVDVFPYVRLLALDVMLRCTCSFRGNIQNTKSFNQYSTLLHYLSPDYWKFKRLCNVVHKFSMDAIQQRRKQSKKPKREKTNKKCFIDILLETKDEHGVGITDLEIRQEVDTILFAGHDTTASGLTWTLYNLAVHPEHQELCRKEVDSIFAEKDHMEYDDLKSLVYLKYCLKESLRLFPPVSQNGRVLASPTKFDDYEMPKGTVVIASIYSVHHNPHVWENPEEFDPLRFTPKRSSGRHPYAFTPFSAGQRSCIGKEFAMNEERVVMAHILRNFEISLDKTQPPVKLEYGLILRPKNGVYLKLKPRN